MANEQNMAYLITGAAKHSRSSARSILGSECESISQRISTQKMEMILEELKNDNNRLTTRDTYYKVWKAFNKFVIKLDRIPKKWEQRVKLYCAYMIKIKRLKSATIKSYISGIKSVLIADGYEWDDNFILLDSFIGSCKHKNDTLKTRLPIRKRLLELILFDIQRKFGEDNQPYLELMYIAAFLLYYYGLLRVGELAKGPHVVKAKNVHECSNQPNKLLLILYSSKTHSRCDLPQQIRIIGKNKLQVLNGKKKQNTNCETNSETNFCPTLWIKRYIKARGIYIDDLEQFLIFSDGSPVQPRHIRKTLRDSLKRLGLEQHLYDVHSFRIGRATDLYKEGVSVEKIKQLGRWRSNSVYKYLRDC